MYIVVGLNNRKLNIDFANMIIDVPHNKTSFTIRRDGQNKWSFLNRNNVHTMLSDSTSEVIEKSYIQWSIETTLLGVNI